MKSGKILVYLFVVFLLSAAVLGAGSQDDSYVLKDPHAGNLYLSSPNIKIKADLFGDLYAVTRNLMINALVKDDVNAVAGNLYLKDTIGSDLRLIGGEVKLDGTVFGETMVIARDVVTTDNAILGGPVKIKAKHAVIDGDMKGDVCITADRVELNGIIEGNAVIETPVLEIGPSAKVLGNLSTNRYVEKDSRIGGEVIKLPDRYSPENITSITLGKIMFFLALLLLGAAAIVVSRKFSERTAKAMYGRFWLSLLTGLIVLVVAPIAGFILLVTVVGMPITILLVFAYIGALILGLGFSAMFLGRLDLKLFRSKRKNALWLELLIGAVILALLSIIPVVFWIILAFLLILATGGMFLAAVRKEERKRKK
jgi:cytoskeletal protein CcmA (bactofilin family)